jgi:hypothetical protein
MNGKPPHQSPLLCHLGEAHPDFRIFATIDRRMGFVLFLQLFTRKLAPRLSLSTILGKMRK